MPFSVKMKKYNSNSKHFSPHKEELVGSFISNDMRNERKKVKLLSHVWLCATLRTVAHQASLSMVFSRQEYWSGFSYPSPGDLPDPGIKPGSPALQTDSLPSQPPGKPIPQDRKDYISCKERKSVNRNLEKTIYTIAFILIFWSSLILYVHTLYLFIPLTL